MSEELNIYSESKIRSTVSLKSLLIISLAVIIVQVIFGFIIYARFSDWNDRSAFGEMFGAVNTLFSGLAFAGVIYAIFLQRRELELQRHELEMTRQELKRSAEAQEKSERALSDQVRELVNQRRLSVMPALVASIQYRTHRVDTSDYFVLTNIGNGLAINIKVAKTEIPFPTLSSGYMTFDEVLMLLPGEERVVECMTFLSETATEGEPNQLTFIKEDYAHGTVSIDISFQDIEGNKYTQTLQMGKGGYKQGFVKLVENEATNVSTPAA